LPWVMKHGSKFVLIVGDTGYNCNSWEQLKLPGPVCDKNKMRTSLRWVQTERLKSDCAAVLAAHDPEGKQNMIELMEEAK
jgi:N-acyl homoserine lactone hydrolase